MVIGLGNIMYYFPLLEVLQCVQTYLRTPESCNKETIYVV